MTKNTKFGEAAAKVVEFIQSSNTIATQGELPQHMHQLHSLIGKQASRKANHWTDSQMVVCHPARCCPHRYNNSHTVVSGGCMCCGIECDKEYCRECSPRDSAAIMWSHTVDSALNSLIAKVKSAIRPTAPDTNPPKKTIRRQKKKRQKHTVTFIDHPTHQPEQHETPIDSKSDALLKLSTLVIEL